MELGEPIFLGLDLAGILTLPTIVVLFAFAVWWGCTRAEVGIDEDEASRRREDSANATAGRR